MECVPAELAEDWEALAPKVQLKDLMELPDTGEELELKLNWLPLRHWIESAIEISAEG